MMVVCAHAARPAGQGREAFHPFPDCLVAFLPTLAGALIQNGLLSSNQGDDAVVVLVVVAEKIAGPQLVPR